MTVSPTIPAPIAQNLSSVRYVAPAVCIIPTQDPDLWGVFVGYPASREPIGIMTTEELLTHLRQSWLDTVRKHNAWRPTPKPVAVTIPASELDDIIADLDFTL